MVSKFEVFTKNKMDALYITENMRTEWLQTLYELWDEGDSGYFCFWPKWLFQYYDELALVEAIESFYLAWKS